MIKSSWTQLLQQAAKLIYLCSMTILLDKLSYFQSWWISRMKSSNALAIGSSPFSFHDKFNVKSTLDGRSKVIAPKQKWLLKKNLRCNFVLVTLFPVRVRITLRIIPGKRFSMKNSCLTLMSCFDSRVVSTDPKMNSPFLLFPEFLKNR